MLLLSNKYKLVLYVIIQLV